MIENLAEYFQSEQEIFLDSVYYKKVDNVKNNVGQDVALTCQDSVKASLTENGVRIMLVRNLVFDPDILFKLTVSFGANLKFNERRSEHDWMKVNLAEEFIKNGDFITAHLMSRISLLIAQITSSYGLQPLMLNPVLAKKVSRKTGKTKSTGE